MDIFIGISELRLWDDNAYYVKPDISNYVLLFFYRFTTIVYLLPQNANGKMRIEWKI